MKIYLAGKMGKHDYRGSIVENYTQHCSMANAVENGGMWPYVQGAAMGFHYVGPYSLPSVAHWDDCQEKLHGIPIKHGGFYWDTEYQASISTACFQAINQCDLFFAWIESTDCYGTLVEIGYAKALGKTVGVYMKEPRKLEYDPLGSYDPDETQEVETDSFYENAEQLWLAMTLGDNHNGFAATALEAFQDFVSSYTVLRIMPYREYLKTPHWQAMRLKALSLADNRCQVCNGKERLEVHHRTYERRGNENLTDLTVLCHKCHSTFHGKEDTQ